MKRAVSCLLAVLLLVGLCACGAPAAAESGLGNGWEPADSMELRYARNFSVDYYEGGYKLISVSDGARYLTVPEGAAVPEGIARDITVLQQPLENIYLAATSAMCLFDSLDSLDSVRLSGTKAEGWYIENARRAMEAGNMIYAGKYSEPDYELLLSSRCSLAIESTMIGHSPEVQEKLETLGIPVFVEQSSLESHPLGRTEWIRLYGALLNREEEAERIFRAQADLVDAIAGEENSGKTVAFFYISTSGYAVARRTGDYVTKMIGLAGGNYIFTDLGDPESNLSTVTLEMEKFYADAHDADIIIYNSTIGGEVSDLNALLAKNSLLKDFRAVQEGNVWCTSQNLFQETTRLGSVIADMHAVFTGDEAAMEELQFLRRLT